MHTVTIQSNVPGSKTFSFKATKVSVTKTRTWWTDSRGVRHYALHSRFITSTNSN